jgi:hypothetical protein
VWSTRDNLAATEPIDYRDILSNLAINSILLHTGSSITSTITTDFLTLDDNDANILNGTPHYIEINDGFAAHGLAGPSVLLAFDFPSGLPQFIDPAGGTTVPVEVTAVIESPQPGTGSLHVDTGGGFTEIPMTEGMPNVYDAVFPAAPCGTQIAYYFSAETASGATVVWPADGASAPFDTYSGTGTVPVFSDDFETDMGWTVSDDGITDGAWERAVPIPNAVCDRGNPDADADGSGQCYVTDNDSALLCNSDVDNGSTILTSPIMDASQGDSVITYWRWFSNSYSTNPFQDAMQVEVSDDGGSSWVTLETVGPSGPDVLGGWYEKSFTVADFVSQTDQFRIRFIAEDANPASVVEAAVDGVRLTSLDCGTQVSGDLNGDGLVGVPDLLIMLADWGACPAPCPPTCPGDINGDCAVDVQDLLFILAHWSV